jgi:hypothetical protein
MQPIALQGLVPPEEVPPEEVPEELPPEDELPLLTMSTHAPLLHWDPALQVPQDSPQALAPQRRAPQPGSHIPFWQSQPGAQSLLLPHGLWHVGGTHSFVRQKVPVAQVPQVPPHPSDPQQPDRLHWLGHCRAHLHVPP